MSTLQLPEIHATSPTLADHARVLASCRPLRAAGSLRFVLGNPKAWLGTAYHEVLKEIVNVDLDQETVGAAVDRLWNKSIANHQRRADAHALDRRFGSPMTWPGYHIAHASVLLRAQELFAGVPPTVVADGEQA